MTANPEVRRVQTDHGSHIEPPFDEDASDLDKLRWQVAVTLHDAGLPRDAVSVYPVNVSRVVTRGVLRKREESVAIPGYFGFTWPGSSSAAYSFHEVWVLLTGVGHGAELQKRLGSRA